MNIPTLIANRYEVLEPLGRGGFGSVFKVKDQETNEIVALKYLTSNESNGLDARRFQREFQHLSRLKHPHIVSVMDIGTDGDACYFTMEYLNGVTLEEALKSPDTGLYRVLQNGGDVFREILVQLCEALACIHAQGLVHRDLKPANIFLQSDQNGPHVKVLDLGLVKFRNDDPSPLTEEGIMLGTVHYMSPEQIRGVHVDHRADLYTLGIVLYEILTGQKPFMGQNSAAVVLKHLNEVPVPPRVYNLDVPHDLQLVVLKLLEKEPERRYRLANDLLNDLVGTKSYAGRIFDENEPPLLLQHPRFLGRSEEMTQARKLLKDVQGGKGRALCISGAAGIGKTRFLEELKADASLRGIQVMHGACYEDHTAPFQPIIECIRSVEKQLGGLNAWVRDEDRSELARLFPELGSKSEISHRTTFQSINQEDLFCALLQLLTDLSHRTSLMLNIDDIQWSDKGTQEFIVFLCNRLNLLPIFLCLAQRTQDDKNSKYLVQFEKLALDPLGPEGSKELLASLFGTIDIPQNFCDDICELSGGNPFATLEVAKALFSNKAIVWRQSKWVYEANIDRLPAEISKAIILRLECLSESDQQILCYIAVTNRPFEFDLIAALLDTSEVELFEQLERLVQYQFLIKDAQDHYQIFHSLIAQTIYRCLSLEEKESLHLELAQVLVASPIADNLANEIAHHFLQANFESDAWPFLVKAGDFACVAYSFVEAKKNYKQTLDIIGKASGPVTKDYLDVLCKYVDVLRWTRDWVAMKKVVEEALNLQNLAPYYYGRLVGAYAIQLMVDGKLDKVEELIKKALKNITEPQFEKVKIQLYITLSQFYWAKGDYDEATKCNEAVVCICQNIVEPFYKTFGYYIMGHDHLSNSRLGAAETAFLTALTEFESQHKDRRYILSCRAALREIYTYRGRFREAEKFSQQIIENAQNTGIKIAEMYETIDLGYIFFEQDKFDQAEFCYLKVIETFKETGDNNKLCQAYVRLSELYLKQGDSGKALKYALKAEKVLSPNLTRQSQVHSGLGKVYATLGNLAKAETCFKKSRTLLEKGQGFHFGLALLESGVFYVEIGSREIAEQYIKQAADMFQKMGANHFLKKAQKIWDQMRENKKAVMTLTEASATLEGALNTTQLLDEAIDRLLQVTHADRGLILTVENDQPRLQTACSRHLDETSLNDISTTVVQAAIESGALIVTSDASNDPRFEDSLSIADSNVGSILCMPLKARNGQIIGVVYADRAGNEDFSVEATSFFKSFAAFVAVGLEHALRSEQLQIDLEKFAGMRTQLGDLVGVSQAMQHLYQTIEQVAHTDVPILLQGETGVGKGLVARTVHEKSTRSNGSFLSVNCGALPRELLESELFGHKKGAFTGASEDRAGLFEAAKGGTLFLDEIGEAPTDVQVLLLHVIEDKVVRRIGENENRPVDVRVVAASNRDLEADVASGVFRQDLYYRLNVMTLTVPPLRDRADDILLLAKHFLNHWNQKLGKSVVGFEAQVRQAFLKYGWPGNIRELDNVVYRSVALADDNGHIGLEHLSDTAVCSGSGGEAQRIPLHSLKAEMANYEKELIMVALDANKWNVTLTAEKLNLSRVALGQKIKKYGIERPSK